MQDLAVSIDVNKLPAVLATDAAQDRIQDLRRAWAGNDADPSGFLEHPEASALVASIVDNSPYLTALMRREPAILGDFLTRGPDSVLTSTMDSLRQALATADSRDVLMKLLRVAKRQIALLAALADVTTTWTLEQVTGALSDLAETGVGYAVAFLLRDRMRRGHLAWTVPEDAELSPELAQGTGYFVLGMGKLGGRELNYSSDIDLIVFYDDTGIYTGKKDVQDCFIRITRDLVQVMQERTPDGYVFRTDLRLRPDAGATPVAISTDAAEIYYQSVGLNWERSAMIKARPVGGDVPAGYGFLELIRAFVWRKHLDYAALEDINAIKNRIHDHNRHGDICVAGQNVKVGPGGIREIEFFVQAHQLIFGGREESLRVRETRKGIDVLKALGTIDPDEAADLDNAYVFLRTLEHRLQMVADDQTHEMPDSPEEIRHIAAFMGYADESVFEEDFLTHLHNVRRHYQGFFDEAHSTEHSTDDDEGLSGLFGENLEGKATAQGIKRLGFEAPERVIEMVQGWEAGRYRALRTERARDILRKITPAILTTFGDTAEPDRALSRFDEFMGQLPSGVQLLSLFQANPLLLDVLAQVLGSAPAIADFLARNHVLLDSVLTPGFFKSLDEYSELEGDLTRELAQARDFQDVLDYTRRWANEKKFQIGIQLLRDIIDPEESGHAHTAVAETVLAGLIPEVEREFAEKHGILPGGSLAIVGMGSFGGREISFTSDLDMIFVYDAPDGITESDGAKPLPTAQYFARLCQRVINALSALTGEGRLYEVDMRLRPSGNAGPIAVSIEGFETYQTKDAWTWEHMALTRARTVFGTPELRSKIDAIIRAILTRPREEATVRKAVGEMRQRMADEFGTDNIWSVKQVRGGLLDLEFMVQFVQLAHAHDQPEILQTQTLEAYRVIRETGLIEKGIADSLTDACRTLAAIRGFSRQCLGGDFDPENYRSPAIRMALARAAGYEDYESLEEALPAIESSVRAAFDSIIDQDN